MKKNNSKYIVNTKRMVCNIMFIFSLIAIFSILTTYDFGKKETITSEVIVQDSDTLWDIANNICKKSNDLNIQNIVYEIKELNYLKSSNIYIGQVLNVPVY